PARISGQKKNLTSPQADRTYKTNLTKGGYNSNVSVESKHSPTPVLENPQWSKEYLQQNWQAVIRTLEANRQSLVAGVLLPATVVALEDDTLTLGYLPRYESLRRRCEERMDRDITEALSNLFGRKGIKCQYVQINQQDLPAKDDKPMASIRNLNSAAPLSSAERAELASDPNVKAVLDFFDGSITGIRRVRSPSDDTGRES
ncbi:MAG: hypothetical protein J7L99_07020, partial [Planctomycetes bacterium]|nr:hypothetical protein [Planctomycetota bacterium]